MSYIKHLLETPRQTKFFMGSRSHLEISPGQLGIGGELLFQVIPKEKMISRSPIRELTVSIKVLGLGRGYLLHQCSREGVDLAGRAFLHSYHSDADPNGTQLETIMTRRQSGLPNGSR